MWLIVLLSAYNGEPYIREQLDSLFAQTMAQLPYTWRTLLQMRNVEDMSFAEIAAITGMTESSVRGTLSKARKRMIELINRQR